MKMMFCSRGNEHLEQSSVLQQQSSVPKKLLLLRNHTFRTFVRNTATEEVFPSWY